MRRIGIAVLALLGSITCLAQTNYTTYTSNGKKYNVGVNYGAGSAANEIMTTVYIGSPDENVDHIDFLISGNSNLKQFSNSLITLKEKYTEWKSVIKNQGVTDLKKKMEVDLPRCDVFWKKRDKTAFASDVRLIPEFQVVNGKCAISIRGEAVSFMNSSQTIRYELILNSETEIQSLISALDYNKIKSFLEKNRQVDQLLK